MVRDGSVRNGSDFYRFQMLKGEIMLQGLIAGWIFILITIALFVDGNLRHAMPAAFGDMLAAAVVTIPIWVPIVLYNAKYKGEKNKETIG